ncbi:malate:quinone oxidoreductase [Pseudomonas sp. NPDC087615]|uniref:malate:quinone oxidoreductase n=1 Tax=Pseudomonas sp. NPDC087615 TaxID=3364443 RepID=UPI0038206F85
MFKKVNTALLGLALSMGLSSAQAEEAKKVDVLLIGGGIMSTTLGVWINELEPSWSMEMVERLDGVALESSNGWNNAGTGHSALAELNYTPEDETGKVVIPKAVEINEAFQISRQFAGYLQTKPNFDLKLSSEVQDITKNADGTWRVSYKNLKDGTKTETDAKFVFIGAGGGALHLLQKSGIPEAKEYGGFPVGGSFLVTENPTIAEQHLAKAYGKASVGSPPMSVPHLDTRVLDGKRVLLFGPFATFSTKFLKEGSYLDLLTSTTTHNIWPMTKVGIKEYPLVEYLAGQLMLSDEDRMNSLKEYFPNAKAEDWRLWQAGQRVQIIKRDEAAGGVLKLGTEIVAAQDGSIAGLLGASPGASTAAPIMLSVLQKVFKDKVATPEWQTKLHQIVPSYGTQLNSDPAKVAAEWAYTAKILELPTPPVIGQAVAPAAEAAADKAAAPKENAARDMAL